MVTLLLNITVNVLVSLVRCSLAKVLLLLEKLADMRMHQGFGAMIKSLLGRRLVPVIKIEYITLIIVSLGH